MRIRNRFTRKLIEDFNLIVFLKNHKRCCSLGKKCLYSEKNSVMDTFLVVIVGGFGLTPSIASKDNLAEAKSWNQEEKLWAFISEMIGLKIQIYNKLVR